ncbi:corticotropin-releasing factor-binding protein isoform X2 [Dendroctonus ponderosae]|uniref:corticotropin-releasing factor-binding protein isoform X2 n=1 Tax=Dendroctonus ponderosae TaxID=77166 RepID=UPI002035EFC4|nr:corticotropin-releasing factor-binding protein isoform X2 [Dendroctonus ponderosae]
MTIAGAFNIQTFFSVSVFALIVSARPDGWMGINPLRSAIRDSQQPSPDFHLSQEIGELLLSPPIRPKRDYEHHIEECVHMISEEGVFYHKAKTTPDGLACGIYIFGASNQKVEIHFNYLNVPCENGGLIAVVDGWELNGELFPSPEDHSKSLKSRFSEFCGQRKIKQTFISSQNVALIQYRMPARGTSFSFSVRYIKNLNPCNILLQLDETYTIRNYDRRSNCSISSLFPAGVKILDINVGITPTRERGTQFELGTLHKCQKRGLDDYVQIGGSLGLDNGNMKLADSVCGLNSQPARSAEYIGCETTTVRLVSSGAFDNSVTVSFTRLTENDIDMYMSVICIPEDLPTERK